MYQTTAIGVIGKVRSWNAVLTRAHSGNRHDVLPMRFSDLMGRNVRVCGVFPHNRPIRLKNPLTRPASDRRARRRPTRRSAGRRPAPGRGRASGGRGDRRDRSRRPGRTRPRPRPTRGPPAPRGHLHRQRATRRARRDRRDRAPAPRRSSPDVCARAPRSDRARGLPVRTRSPPRSWHKPASRPRRPWSGPGAVQPDSHCHRSRCSPSAWGCRSYQRRPRRWRCRCRCGSPPRRVPPGAR